MGYRQENPITEPRSICNQYSVNVSGSDYALLARTNLSFIGYPFLAHWGCGSSQFLHGLWSFWFLHLIEKPSEVTPTSPPWGNGRANFLVSVPVRGCDPPMGASGGKYHQSDTRKGLVNLLKSWWLIAHLSFKFCSLKSKHVHPRSKLNGFLYPILNPYG